VRGGGHEFTFLENSKLAFSSSNEWAPVAGMCVLFLCVAFLCVASEARRSECSERPSSGTNNSVAHPRVASRSPLLQKLENASLG
jgi:hypothetical protein